MFLNRIAPTLALIASLGGMTLAHAEASPAPDAREISEPADSKDGKQESGLATAVQPEILPEAKNPPTQRPTTVPFKILTGAANGQRYPDTVLRVVEPSRKTLDVGLVLVGALLGSFRMPLDKEDYRGDKVENVKHPAVSSLFKNLQQAVDGWRKESAVERIYENPVVVRPDTFALVYSEYDAEQPTYDLYLQTTVSRKPDSAGWFTAPTTIVCRNQYNNPALSLEQWAVDDYLAVKEKSQEHVANCIAKMQPEFGQLFAE